MSWQITSHTNTRTVVVAARLSEVSPRLATAVTKEAQFWQHLKNSQAVLDRVTTFPACFPEARHVCTLSETFSVKRHAIKKFSVNNLNIFLCCDALPYTFTINVRMRLRVSASPQPNRIHVASQKTGNGTARSPLERVKSKVKQSIDEIV